MRDLVPGGRLLGELATTRRVAGSPVDATTTPSTPRPGTQVPTHAGPAADEASDGAPVGGPSAYVRHRLAAWRLLHDLPFGYLVPDASMLPPESIRFFHVDPGWLDALCDAALALGADPATWPARAPVAAAATRRPALESMRWVREVQRGRVVVGASPLDLPWPPKHWLPPDPVTAPAVSGFLLRSALVSGWRGTQVRAWTTAAVPSGADAGGYAADHPGTVVPLLRVERLSPGILLVLFGGIPRLVWLEEPHQGVQLGVDVVPGTGHLPDVDPRVDHPFARQVETRSYVVAVRDETGAPTGATVAVPMRSGALPGTLDVGALADALDAARPLPAPRGGAALGLTLLQPPARQRFAGSGG